MSYTRNEKVEREEFVRQMEREGMTGKVASLILRDAATMQRLAVADCNRGLTPAEQKRDEQCQERIVSRCEPHGIKPNFQGDPRGAVVKLILPSGKWNSWGGAECGFCVPTPYC